jgi:hypothetical protein
LAILPVDVSIRSQRVHTPYPGMNIDVAALTAIAVCKAHDAISRKRCFRTGRMMTMKSLNGVVNKTSSKSVEPWIHVRAMLVAKLWIGLRALSVQWDSDFHTEQQQYSFAGASS